MTNDQELKPRRGYSTPTLVAYGDMASLTKAGAGSVIETSQTPTNMRRQIRP